jgi:microcystin-dependent protein
MPSHNHTASVVDGGHIHPIAQFYSRPINYGSENSTPVLQKEPGANSTLVTPTVDNTGTLATTGIAVNIANTGGGQPHANNQPAYGMCYIVYIP